MKKEKVPFYVELADHVETVETFDMNDNSGQYPNIHWIIARSMLEEFSEFDRHQLLTHRAGQVRRAFVHAMNHLQQKGVIVYRSRGKGKRNIDFISLDPNYANCKALDFNRQKNNIQSRVESFSEQVQLMHPDQASLITSEAKRFNNKLIGLD